MTIREAQITEFIILANEKALFWAKEQGWYCGRKQQAKDITYYELAFKSRGSRYVSELRQILFTALYEAPKLSFADIAKEYNTHFASVHRCVRNFQYNEEQGIYLDQVALKNELCELWKKTKKQSSLRLSQKA